MSLNLEILEELVAPQNYVPPTLYFKSVAHLQSVYMNEINETYPCPVASPISKTKYSKQENPVNSPVMPQNLNQQSLTYNNEFQLDALKKQSLTYSNEFQLDALKNQRLSYGNEFQLDALKNQRLSYGNEFQLDALKNQRLTYGNEIQLDSLKNQTKSNLPQLNETKGNLTNATINYLYQRGYSLSGNEVWSGAFGIVRKAIKTYSNGAQATVALKFPQNKINNNETFKEYAINKVLEHKFMIRLIDVFEEIQCLIFEFAEFGSIYEFLVGCSEGIGWIRRLTWAMQICEGIMYLHSKKLIHGDIRTKNVLLDSFLTAKISDFGQAIFLGKGYEGPGPALYVSNNIYQEIHQRKQVLKNEQFEEWVDVSFFAVLLGHLLFHNQEHKNFTDTHYGGAVFEAFIYSLPSWSDENYKEIIRSCLSTELRTFDQIFLALNVVYRKIMENVDFFDSTQDINYFLQEFKKSNIMEKRNLAKLLSNCSSKNKEISQVLLKEMLSFCTLGDEEAVNWCLAYRSSDVENLIDELLNMIQITERESRYEECCSIIHSFKFLKPHILNLPTKLAQFKAKLLQLLKHYNPSISQMSIYVIGELRLKDDAIVEALKYIFAYPETQLSEPFEKHSGFPIVKGSLVKESGDKSKWQKREVELRSDRLCYYKGSKLKGAIDINEIDGIELVSYNKRTFVLKIQTKYYDIDRSNPNVNVLIYKKQIKRNYFFDTGNQKIAHTWLENFGKVFPIPSNRKLLESEILEFFLLICFVKLELINEYIWRRLIRYLHYNNSSKSYTIQALGEVYAYFQKYQKPSLFNLDKALISYLLEPNYWKVAVKVLKYRKTMKKDESILNALKVPESDLSLVCTLFSKHIPPPVESGDIVATHLNSTTLKKWASGDLSSINFFVQMRHILPYAATYGLIKTNKIEENKIASMITNNNNYEAFQYIISALPSGNPEIDESPNIIVSLLHKTFHMDFEVIKKKVLLQLLQTGKGFKNISGVLSEILRRLPQLNTQYLQYYNLNFLETLKLDNIQPLLDFYSQNTSNPSIFHVRCLIIKIISKYIPFNAALNFVKLLNLPIMDQKRLSMNRDYNINVELQDINKICLTLKGNNIITLLEAQQQFEKHAENNFLFSLEKQKDLELALSTLCDLLEPFIESSNIKKKFTQTFDLTKKSSWAAKMFSLIVKQNTSAPIRHDRAVLTLYKCLILRTTSSNEIIQRFCFEAFEKIEPASSVFSITNILEAKYEPLYANGELKNKLYRALGIILAIQKLKEENNNQTIAILMNFASHTREEIQIYALRALSQLSVSSNEVLNLYDKVQFRSIQVQKAYIQTLGELAIKEINKSTTSNSPQYPLLNQLFYLLQNTKEMEPILVGTEMLGNIPLIDPSIHKDLISCFIFLLNTDILQIKSKSLEALKKWIESEPKIRIENPQQLVKIIQDNSNKILGYSAQAKGFQDLSNRITHILLSNLDNS